MPFGLLRPHHHRRRVRNASLWLDLRIVVMTALMFFRGDRRTAHVETAWTKVLQINEPQPRRTAAPRAFAPSRVVPRGKEHAAPSAARYSGSIAGSLRPIRAGGFGWKLALVTQGRAIERLLGTYEAERRPVCQNTTTNTNLLSGNGVLTRLIRDYPFISPASA